MGRLWFISLLVLGCAVAQKRLVPNYEQNYAEAKQAYARGQFQEAEWSMAAALAEVESGTADDPRLPNVLFELAEIQRAQGKYAEAEPLLERLVAWDEAHVAPASATLAKALDALGNIYRAQAKFD